MWPTRKSSEFEKKIGWFVFLIIVTAFVIFLVYDSQTNVKKCKKQCDKKGFERSLYVEKHCECFKMVKTEKGEIMVGEDEE